MGGGMSVTNPALADLADRYWDRVISANPTWAILLGDHRFDDQVEDLSRAAEDAMIDDLRGFVAEAEAIDPNQLDTEDRITRDVLIFEASTSADELEMRPAELATDPHIGLHVTMIAYAPQFPLTEKEHAAAVVAKYRKFGTMFDAMAERYREGVASGRTPPRVAAEKSLRQVEQYLALELDDDPYLTVAPPPQFTDAERQAWHTELRTAVADVIRPAYERYGAVIRDEVLGAARPPEHSGVCWLPDGDEYYRRAIRRYTSLNLNPEDVHQSGLDEIAELAHEYVALGGPVVGSVELKDIFEHLRHDSSLRFATRDEVRRAAETSLAKAKSAIGDWFGRLPQADCVIGEIPDVGAEESPIAYYLPPATDGSRPGVYFVNTLHPETRTRFEYEALAYHESIPGHHLQLAIAQEVEVPEFRKHALVTVYVEGWGLYTERLADEMGLYSGDLQRLGILSFDSWRAGRLVVDTGMHALGWSRQQAIDFLIENSPQAPNNIENEVDRYIGWPGQALAYKIGQREIFRLRRVAQESLGNRFDIKGFHDTVLEPGPVPLDTLGRLVDEWIAGGG